MKASLLHSFPHTFTLKPILFGGKAMEFHGLRSGNDYDLLVHRDEFRSLWTEFPDQRVIDANRHRLLRFDLFEFYEHQFGYDYVLLSRDAIDQGDHLVLTVEMLTFLTIVRLKHNSESIKVKRDCLLLLQKLDLSLLLPESKLGLDPLISEALHQVE